MNGIALRAQIEKIAPKIRTVFMSGYTEEVFGRESLHGADLIRKPFTVASLTEKIREVLDR